MHHNTTSLNPEELSIKNAKALKQEDLVLHIFEEQIKLGRPYLTGSEVHALFLAKRGETGEKVTPITSIRRSMTNLCKRDKLSKTSLKQKGPYGDPEHKYRLRYVSISQSSLFPKTDY